VALVVGWVAVAALSFLLDRLAGVRFLNLPLGLFVAGQGALIALVIVAVRAARDDDDAQF
jgi:putative solute:sodium symporter small subunit